MITWTIFYNLGHYLIGKLCPGHIKISKYCPQTIFTIKKSLVDIISWGTLLNPTCFHFFTVALNSSFSGNFPQQKRFHHNFFQKFLFLLIPLLFQLSFLQMFMAVLKSNSESSGPCIETIINPCNMVLVKSVPQCCLSDNFFFTSKPYTNGDTLLSAV